MAEKPDKSTAAGPEEKSKKKLYVIIGAAVLFLLIGGGAALYLLKKAPAEDKEDPGLAVPIPEINRQTMIGPMVDIKEFIVNIISEDNTHYVKAALTIELSSEPTKEELNSRLPQIRDAILLLVGNKTFEELQDLQGKMQLKAELLNKVNSILQSGHAKAIYFTDFVVQ